MKEEFLSPKLLAVTIIIQNQKQDILLNKRKKDPQKGMWQLLAGYVTPGERLTDTVKRLMKETMGLESILSIIFRGNYYDDPARQPGGFCIPLLFITKVADNILPETERETKWFSKQELKDIEMVFDNKQMLVDAGCI